MINKTLFVLSIALIVPALVRAKSSNVALKKLEESSPEPSAAPAEPAAVPVKSDPAQAQASLAGLWRTDWYVDQAGFVSTGPSNPDHVSPRYYRIAVERGAMGVTLDACDRGSRTLRARTGEPGYLLAEATSPSLHAPNIGEYRRYECQRVVPDMLACVMSYSVFDVKTAREIQSHSVELLRPAAECPEVAGR